MGQCVERKLAIKSTNHSASSFFMKDIIIVLSSLSFLPIKLLIYIGVVEIEDFQSIDQLNVYSKKSFVHMTSKFLRLQLPTRLHEAAPLDSIRPVVEESNCMEVVNLLNHVMVNLSIVSFFVEGGQCLVASRGRSSLFIFNVVILHGLYSKRRCRALLPCGRSSMFMFNFVIMHGLAHFFAQRVVAGRHSGLM